MIARPIRFLVLVLGGWVCLRAAMLSPGWWRATEVGAPAAAGRAEPRSAEPGGDLAAVSGVPSTASMPHLIRQSPYKVRHAAAASNAFSSAAAEAAGQAAPGPARPPRPPQFGAGPPAPASLPGGEAPALRLSALPARPAVAGHWSASAWMLIRRDGGRAGLAPSGTLGGSQAGARLGYRLGGGLSLSARIYAPIRRPAEAELAAGLAWRPARAVPVEFLAERRQAFGGQGRSAFSIAAHGGTSLALRRGLRLDLYGQAGLVGLRSRDAFVDASARASTPVGPIDVGAGIWGGAQPGASRIDAGPALSWRLPAARGNFRIEAAWRFRLAGHAAPGSGPALAIAADF